MGIGNLSSFFLKIFLLFFVLFEYPLTTSINLKDTIMKYSKLNPPIKLNIQKPTVIVCKKLNSRLVIEGIIIATPVKNCVLFSTTLNKNNTNINDSAILPKYNYTFKKLLTFLKYILSNILFLLGFFSDANDIVNNDIIIYIINLFNNIS